MTTQRHEQYVYYDSSDPEEHYRRLQWGTKGQPSQQPKQPEHSEHQIHSRNHEQPIISVDFSRVAAVDTGFKKLKSNQIQILKELRREYQVLRNTELDSGIFSNRPPTESGQSVDDSGSKSQSDALSSCNSKVDRTRRKTQNKEMQVAALERKQMELMLNNSMKKIEHLLASEIELKKTVAELKLKLGGRQSSQGEHQLLVRKYKEEVLALGRSLEQTRKEGELYRSKSKEVTVSMGSLQGELAVAVLQLRKKEERLKALQEQVYLQKNKCCSMELDVKKYKFDYQMLQRNYKEEVTHLQRRLVNSEERHSAEQSQDLRKLKAEVELKDQRYRLLQSHFNQEREDKETLLKKQEQEQRTSRVQQQERHDNQYVSQLQDLVKSLRQEKERRSGSSEDLLRSLLQKVSEIGAKPNQQLHQEISSLKRQLEAMSSREKTQSTESVLRQKLRELQRQIEDENTEKMYFIDDIKKIKNQLSEERRLKEEAQSELRTLKVALRRVEEEASRYSVELEALRQLDELQVGPSKGAMVRSQHLKEMQVVEMKSQLSRVMDSHHGKVKQYQSVINQYEEQIKVIKRRLAEEQIKSYKIKQELQLQLSLMRTQHQAEVHHLQEELANTKKSQANQINWQASQRVHLEEQLLQKIQEAQQLNSQLTAHLKEKDNFCQEYKVQQDKRVMTISEDHASKVSHLASKLEGLADISHQHMQLLQRSAWLQTELNEMRKNVRLNRNVNEGVDHLWSIKEAEYSNLNTILKALQ